MQITKLNTQEKYNLDAQSTFVVKELVGDHALQIIDFLQDKEKISEFIIAEELGMEINETRNILYKLLEHNIVTFLRKKDRIKGWYICYWDFNPGMMLYLQHKILVEKREKMQERLNQEEEGQFFICKNTCSRMTFELAVEQNFKCSECGQVMQDQDNTRTKEFLRERITELDAQIKVATPKRKVAYEEEPVIKVAKIVKAKVAKVIVKTVATKKPAAKKKK